MSREIMQQALSAFEEIMFTKNVGSSHIIAKNARYALREELAKPEQIVIPDFPEPFSKADIQSSAPESWDDEMKNIWIDLQVCQRNKTQLHKYAKHLREMLGQALAQPEQEPAIGDIRALKHRIHELEGELIGCKRIFDAQEEQEPVAWVTRRTGDGGVVLSGYETCEPTDYDATPVYTAPPSTSGYAKKIESLIKERDELRKALAQPEQVIDGNTSDGYHTFNELYDFRKAYNAALFNEWAAIGKYSVHKSKRHFDGEVCFGGGWFIVVAQLPDGQISNHYETKDWDKFQVPETDKALFEYDNHTGEDVLHRLFSLCSLAQPEHPLDKKADNARELGLDYEPEQEPVAWMHVQGYYEEPNLNDLSEDAIARGWEQYPLYTAPPKREWVGLTDEDIDWVFGLAYADDMELLKTIETKLREKNG